MPELTVVVPMRDEGAVAGELVRRACGALAGVDAEVLVVDDQSTDGTGHLAREAGARVLSLGERHGQLRATLAGIAASGSPWVATLDGDLQDPPELLAKLWAARGGVDVVYAVKARRGESRRFRIARRGYGLALRAAGAPLPAGAGSYALFTRAVADRVVGFGIGEGNLAVLLAATRPRYGQVPYDKGPRPHGRSRVGALGLAREAVASLVVVAGAAWSR